MCLEKKAMHFHSTGPIGWALIMANIQRILNLVGQIFTRESAHATHVLSIGWSHFKCLKV